MWKLHIAIIGEGRDGKEGWRLMNMIISLLDTHSIPSIMSSYSVCCEPFLTLSVHIRTSNIVEWT